MKVYVLTDNYTNVETGESTHEVVGVYYTLEKAQERFNEKVKEAKKFMECYSNLEERKGKGFWIISEKDNYFALHIALFIRVKEVK